MNSVLLVDAVGTVLDLKQPVAEYYAEAAQAFDLDVTAQQVRERFSDVFRRFFTPWQNKLAPDWSRQENHWLEAPQSVDAWLSQPETHAAFRELFSLPVSEQTEQANWRSLVDDVFFPTNHSAVNKKATADTKAALFDFLWNKFAEPEVWEFSHAAISKLAQWRSAGYQICLASNFDQRLQQIVSAQHPALPIDHVFVSGTIGYRKPDPRFYLAILEQLGANPATVWMIGDRWWEDYAAPRVCGINSLLYHPNGSSHAKENVRLVRSWDSVRLP